MEEKNIVLNNNGEEVEVDNNGMVVLDGYHLTKYEGYLKDCYVKDEYICDDIEGVIKKEKKPIDVCGPITLLSIRKDRFTNTYYYEFQFLTKEGEKLIKTFKGSELGTQNMIKELKDLSFDIINKTSFENFINTMIKSNDVIKKNTQKYKIETDWMSVQVGADRYGYPITNTGYDFTRFIKKDEIINTDPLYDGPLFEKSGTLEKQIDVIDRIGQDFKDEVILKLAMAFAACGLVIAHVNIDTICIAFTGPSGCGKQVLSDLIAGFWGKNNGTNTGIQRHSGDSVADRANYKSHFGVLPTEYDEFQDEINRQKKNGLTPSQVLKEFSYEITTGSNGSRSNADGTHRNDNKLSKSPTVIFCEGNQFGLLTDGGSNRCLIIDAGIPDGTHYVKSEDTRQYLQDDTENYGHLQEIFIDFMINKYNEDKKYIVEKFNEVKKETDEIFSDKMSSNVALLITTYNLLVESGCMPARWTIWDEVERKKVYTFLNRTNKFQSSTELVFDTWIADTINNGCIPWYDKTITQAEYDDVRNTAQQIRGKKEIKDNKYYVYISQSNLKQQLEHVAEKILKVDGFVFDIQRIAALGVLEKSGDKDRPYRHRMVNIEREFNKSRGTGDERVLKICIDSPEREVYKEALESKKKEIMAEVEKKRQEKGTSIASNW